MLPEVDLGDVHRDLVHRGEVAVDEGRRLAHAVGRRRHHAVAVGVDQVVVGPRAARDAGEVELARRDRDVLVACTERVVADVERRLELVEGRDLLLVVERRRQLVRVEQADLRRTTGPGHRRGGRRTAAGAVLLGGDVLVEPERLHRGGLVVLDGRPVEGRGARLLTEAIDQRRPHRAEEQCGDDHPAQGDADPAQPAQPDVGDQQHPEHDREDGQDGESGQRRVHVGVGEPGHRAAVGRGQLVATQPVRRALEQQVEPEEQRDLGLERRRQLRRPRPRVRMRTAPYR